MRQRAADRVGLIGADQHSGVGTSFVVSVVPGEFEFFTCLPPAVLHADGAGDDIFGHARFDFDRTFWSFNRHPFFVLNAVTRCGFGVNIGARLGQRFAQTS